jgi:crooked neck
MMPTPKKVRRQIDEFNQEEGSQASYVYDVTMTYFCYLVWEMVFPDDLRESNPGSFKFMAMAQAWKAKGSLLAPPVSNGNSSMIRKTEDDGEDEEDEASSNGDAMETS